MKSESGTLAEEDLSPRIIENCKVSRGQAWQGEWLLAIASQVHPEKTKVPLEVFSCSGKAGNADYQGSLNSGRLASYKSAYLRRNRSNDIIPCLYISRHLNHSCAIVPFQIHPPLCLMKSS